MKDYGPFALRLGLGGLFLTTGVMKVLNPSMVVQMLQGIGFPAPVFWTWVLTLSELLCGAAVLTGFKLKYATLPLMVVLLVAITTNPLGGPMNPLKDTGLLTGLVSLWLSGPGEWALSRR